MLTPPLPDNAPEELVKETMEGLKAINHEQEIQIKELKEKLVKALKDIEDMKGVFRDIEYLATRNT